MPPTTRQIRLETLLIALSVLPLHKPDHDQEHHRTDKSTNQIAEQPDRRQPQQREQKTTKQRADNAHDDVSNETETVSLDHCARQKPGGHSDENKPEPVHGVSFRWLFSVANRSRSPSIFTIRRGGTLSSPIGKACDTFQAYGCCG